jgi:hypothetical protein
MVQGRGGTGLLLKAAQAFGIGCQVFRKDLDGNVAV